MSAIDKTANKSEATQQSQTQLLRLAMCVCLTALTAVASGQPVLRTRVVLDQDTFSTAEHASLQALADQVAGTIDNLIPGVSQSEAAEEILCYQVAEARAEMRKAITAPITLMAGTRLPYEPASVVPGRIRIALYGVEPNRHERFVYQLAHELAHVKMGPSIDNYLLETFAVAISFEVLARMNMQNYLLSEIISETSKLPPAVGTALFNSDVVSLRAWWQQTIPSEEGKINDRGFQTIGAALIRLQNPVWASLLGIGLRSTGCEGLRPPYGFMVCNPIVSSIPEAEPMLRALGYSLR